jgi:hypothetical protein
MANVVRYLETGDYGEKTGRQLIARVDADLPAPASGATWIADPSFDLATELLDAPSFSSVVDAVLKSGHQVVELALKAKGK